MSLEQNNVNLSALAPVLVVGVPGLAFDYLENLETIGVSGRQVIFVNTCDARRGMDDRSDRPSEVIASAELAAAQLMAASEARGLARMHVVAHGLGAPAALRFVAALTKRSEPPQPPAEGVAAANGAQGSGGGSSPAGASPTGPGPLLSLTLLSPYGGLDDLKPMASQRILDFAEMFPEDEAYPVEGEQCVVEANALTGVPWRRLLLADDGAEGEKNQLGRGRLSAMLPKAVPTTVIHGGATDAVVPSWDLGKTVRLVDYPRSGHLPFIDERELFLFDLLDWLDGIDKVKTPRIGLVNGNTKYGN